MNLKAFWLLPAAAWALSPPQYLGGRALGMGGAFTAISDDYTALYHNPAGLALLHSPLDAGVALRLDLGDFFGLAPEALDMAGAHADKLGDMSALARDNSLTDDLMRLDRRPIGFGTMPEMHFAVKSTDPDLPLGLGAGWYLGSRASFQIDKGIYIPSAEAGVRSDLILKLAAAGRVAPGLYAGVSPTLGTYSRIVQSVSIQDYANAQDSLNAQLERERRKIFYPNFGWGWDFGLLYEILPTELRVGAAAKNLFLSLDGEKVPASYSLGLAYMPAPLRRQGMLRFVNLALDLEDLAGDKPFLAKVNMGAEMNMTLAQIRGGLRGGYPCYGLGLNLLVFQFEFVSWADELGRYVGQIEDRHYLFSMRLGI